MYPDYYGGAYIDLNSGKLVVQLTDCSNEIVNSLKKVTDNEYLIIEEVAFSYNELI